MNLHVRQVKHEEVAEAIAAESNATQILFAGQGVNLHKTNEGGKTVVWIETPAGECLAITVG